MNDRQRLEAIIAVVCKYLPPDGISGEQAMSQIIELVDPLPEQPETKLFGVVIGVAIVFVISILILYVWPWLWSVIKPFIHMVIA